MPDPCFALFVFLTTVWLVGCVVYPLAVIADALRDIRDELRKKQ